MQEKSSSEPARRSPFVAREGSPFPKLVARRCRCGAVFHPPHGHGCERCGLPGAATTEVEIEPRGVLTAVTTVSVHPKLPVPYRLGRVLLDDGLAIDVRLDAGAELGIGARVRARLFEESGAAGAERVDCRFVAEGDGS
jgi:uncharacterized OB-fold protein